MPIVNMVRAYLAKPPAVDNAHETMFLEDNRAYFENFIFRPSS
jgi:hypothetical protein